MASAEVVELLRDPARVADVRVLVEIDHAGGTIRLGSHHWRSDAAHGYFPYDGWLTKRVVIEEGLRDFLDVGDVTALNAADDIDWTGLAVRGYPSRFLIGAAGWTHSQFHTIATSLNVECRRVRGRTARFDLSTAGAVFSRRHVGEDRVLSGSVESVVRSIARAAGAADPVFSRVSAERLRWGVRVTLTESRTLGVAMLTAARSIGAHIRFTALGRIEVFTPDRANAVRLTRDDLVRGSMVTEGVTPAYRQVLVRYGDDLALDPIGTGADTGRLDETAVVQTALLDRNNTESVARDWTDYHSVRHDVRKVRVIGLASTMSVGDVVDIEDDDYAGEALVSHIRREPPARVATIEIET